MDVEQVKLERIRDRLDALIEWSMSELTWPTPRGSFSLLMQTSLVDALRTSAAIAVLSRDGYGREGLKLARSVTETAIVAFWMAHGPHDERWILHRIAEHEHHTKTLWQERLRDEGDANRPAHRALIRVDPETRARWNVLYGEFGQKSWWANEVTQHPKTRKWKRDAGASRDTRALVAALRDVPELREGIWNAVANPSVADAFQYILDVPQRFNDHVHHHGPLGLSTLMSGEGNDVHIARRPSDDWAPQAVVVLYQCLALLAILAVDRYRPDLKEDLFAVLDPHAFAAFVNLDDEQAEYARQNRNQPCPCGSGFKSKKCHGAPLS
ncbi:DUF5677 domain-containing protein [Patulibacter medicamentivorans]|uniref:DUF5677 domain-containing protein n=1 Tax=Patulibacter medicamentivorans TaxID=1097667 RepID=UPI0005912650|nr:DUF5677 domain-containing protein [Patulibacter medicamentivorans]